VLSVPVPAFSAASLLPGILPGFQLPPAVLACLLVWLLPVSAAAAGPLFASRLPGGRASLLPFLLPVIFQASSCRRGYAAGAGLPSLLPGYFLFLDPVKLPGIEDLYQTIYNYNIYKTIQDHFSSCLFLLPGQTIPLVNFFIAGNALFSRLPGISAKYF